MNATNSNNKEAKSPENQFMEIGNQITEFYTKQLGLVTDFYKKLINTDLTANGALTNHVFYPNSLFGYEMPKLLLGPLANINSGFANPFLLSLDKLNKQIIDNNSTMMSSITHGLKNSSEVSEFALKYHDLLILRLQSIQHLIKMMTDASKKMMDVSTENNLSLVDELNNQFVSLTKLNLKFWSEALNSQGTSVSEGAKGVKDPTGFETKKRSTGSPAEFTEHKV